MKDTQGSLSRVGIVVVPVILLLLVGTGLVWGIQLFSPGPLSARGSGEPLGGVRSHAETGRQCLACHTALWSHESMADRCTLCHADVSAQLHDPTSLHGMVMRSGQIQTCFDCHPEHQGEDAPLITLNPATFPHQATGYSLQGHRQTADGSPFACADCHGKDLLHMDPARCDGCHRELDPAYMQEHESDSGSDCLDCHDGIEPPAASVKPLQTG